MPRAIHERKNVVLFGWPIVTLGVILHAYQLVVELRLIRDAPPFEADVFPARLQMFLLLSLLLAAAGLALGRRWGLVASSLGLLGVLLGYTYWFYDSHRSLHTLAQEPFYTKHPEFVPPNLFGLIGARWWDLVLLIMFLALLIWQISVLVRMSGKHNGRRAQ